MLKLTDERLTAIREDCALFPEGHTTPTETELMRAFHQRPALLEHITAQETEIATLIQQVRNQAADLEDTRAAYQLTRHQLDAHRAGQGTWVHAELGGHTEIIHDSPEGITR